MDTVLIGGGRAAEILLKFFSDSSDLRVVEVVDVRSDAPGILMAQDMGIRTSQDVSRAVQGRQVGMVIELTGRPEVREEIAGLLREGQELIDSNAARILVSVVRALDKQREQVVVQFEEVGTQLKQALQSVQSADSELLSVLREARILSINGKIEASRAGNEGRAFGVVVTGMLEMISRLNDASTQIASATSDGQAMIQRLADARARYRSGTGEEAN